MAIFVVTNTEMGWNCVSDVYEADNKQQVINMFLEQTGETEEQWERTNVVHKKTLYKLN